MKGYGKPLPKINGDNREFWEGCKEHALRFQKCEKCGHVRWPAAMICPMCHSRETRVISARGTGRIYTFVVYHAAYHPGFENDLPYVVADVELEEGPHVLTNIVGCEPREVSCDLPVEVVWEDVTEEISLPRFRPAC